MIYYDEAPLHNEGCSRTEMLERMNNGWLSRANLAKLFKTISHRLQTYVNALVTADNINGCGSFPPAKSIKVVTIADVENLTEEQFGAAKIASLGSELFEKDKQTSWAGELDKDTPMIAYQNKLATDSIMFDTSMIAEVWLLINDNKMVRYTFEIALRGRDQFLIRQLKTNDDRILAINRTKDGHGIILPDEFHLEQMITDILSIRKFAYDAKELL